MNGKLSVSLIMFPVGAACGFACGFISYLGCILFDLIFGRGEFRAGPPADVSVLIFAPLYYSAVVGIAAGAPLGFVAAPLTYALGFRHLGTVDLVRWGRRITAGTAAAGLLGGLANALLWDGLGNVLPVILISVAGWVVSTLLAAAHVRGRNTDRAAA